MSATPQEILEFWLNDVGEKRWYEASDDLDEAVRRRFSGAWRAARLGAFDHWLVDPSSALALIILLDQFPRNMFRDRPQAFAADERALRLAKLAIARGHDLRVPEPARQFFYLPLMHSEAIADQDRCVRLVAARMPQSRARNLPHARAHREVIRRFGRFPFRNAALGRASTPEEEAYLAAGGYARTVHDMAA
ncbi:DUF924 family protein [Oceanicella actignis]|uniref:DUF924 family protein n=1 Tax=Oceanicella actignis TaxID=1189325 RepID=UPI0011E71E11|nr:DUF924 family protein [Oceanicella actignis]TYO85024.1 uncharacterized protein (DUF924 family) [Oceanicella actignis]